MTANPMRSILLALVASPCVTLATSPDVDVPTPTPPTFLFNRVDEPAKVSVAAGTSASDTEDKSGTDPTKFLRSVRLTTEYARLTNDKSAVTTSVQYVQPLGESTNLRLKVPTVWTDVAGTGDFGLGDLALRFNWLADVNTERGILVGAELIADTASEATMGRGKWIIQPFATYAFFLNKNMIFAPTYQHNLSFAGDSNRSSVNESVFDFYFVITADDKKSWITIDPALAIDWQNSRNTPFSVEVQFGRRLGTLWGGALNGSITPGVGIGKDRPYDWNIAIGFNLTGF